MTSFLTKSLRNDNKMNEKLFLVDKDGVIVDEIDEKENFVKVNSGDRVLRNATLKYLSDFVEVKYHFVKVNPVIFGKYVDKYPILGTLICHVGYSDNILQYRNGRLLDIKGIIRITKKSETTVRRQIRGMIQDDILHVIKEKGKKPYYMLNPFIATVGKKIFKNVYDEFKFSHLSSKIEEYDK